MDKTNEREIFRTVERFHEAYKNLDYEALRNLCLPKMFSKHFGVVWKIETRISKFLAPKKWRKISVSDIKIESRSDNRSEVVYQVVFLDYIFQEKALLEKDRGIWKFSKKKGVVGSEKSVR